MKLRRPTPRALAGAALATLALSGCGLLPAVDADRTQPAALTAAQTSPNEVPTPPGPKERVVSPQALTRAHALTPAQSPTPIQALRGFATAYINWTAADVASRLRALARESVGQARSELQLAASDVAVDSQLRQAGIGNSGTVEAVARLSGSGDRYVVVTREQTTATNSTTYAGLGPQWHVTIATVERVAVRGGAEGAERWAVSGWQPQS